MKRYICPLLCVLCACLTSQVYASHSYYDDRYDRFDYYDYKYDIYDVDYYDGYNRHTDRYDDQYRDYDYYDFDRYDYGHRDYSYYSYGRYDHDAFDRYDYDGYRYDRYDDYFYDSYDYYDYYDYDDYYGYDHYYTPSSYTSYRSYTNARHYEYRPGDHYGHCPQVTVCGLKNGHYHWYGSACLARDRGATIVHDSYCENGGFRSCSNGADNYPYCTVCPHGQTMQGGHCVNTSHCPTLPTHGYWIYGHGTSQPYCDFRCQSGYQKVGNSCVKNTCDNGSTNYPHCNSCPAGQIYQHGQCIFAQSCGTKPSFSSWIQGHGNAYPNCTWECNTGFYRSGNACLPLSCQNGALNYPNCNACANGQHMVNGSCVGGGYNWYTGLLSTCSRQCDGGIQHRTVECRDSSGTRVSDTFCAGLHRPAASQSCNTHSCENFTYQWHTSSFGACSESCGGGLQYRSVTCRRADGYTVANSLCSGAEPVETQSCNTHACTTNTGGGGHDDDDDQVVRPTSINCGPTKPNSIGFTGSPSCTPVCKPGFNLTSVGGSCVAATTHDREPSRPSCSGTVSCKVTGKGKTCTTNKCPVGCVAEKKNRHDCFNTLRHNGNSQNVTGENYCGSTQTLTVRCVNN